MAILLHLRRADVGSATKRRRKSLGTGTGRLFLMACKLLECGAAPRHKEVCYAHKTRPALGRLTPVFVEAIPQIRG